MEIIKEFSFMIPSNTQFLLAKFTHDAKINFQVEKLQIVLRFTELFAKFSTQSTSTHI